MSDSHILLYDSDPQMILNGSLQIGYKVRKKMFLLFSLFMRSYAQVMNLYREGEMSTEVDCRPKFVD
mgnify:CR=1 FL=1